MVQQKFNIYYKCNNKQLLTIDISLTFVTLTIVKSVIGVYFCKVRR